MCNLCAQNEAVLPCLEAFEMGLEIPSIYFLFYEYFFKPSVGDVRWKRACMEANDKTDLLGLAQAEAFAMIVLKNNYFAWLLDAKEKLKTLLVTDYDPETKRAGMRTASEVYLKRLQLNVNGGDDEDLIVAEGHVGYDELKKDFDDMVKKTRRLAKGNATYKEVKKALETIQQGPQSEAAQDEDADDMYEEDRKREHLRKKRKILKPLREYTVRQGEEGRFKGWSMRAAGDLAALCRKIKDERDNCAKFRAAYREIYQTRHQTKPKVIEVGEVVVDYSEVWDVGEVAAVEI
jgi:hypothetical protein